MSFRDNLQSLRAEKGLTQEQLAMMLGVSRQSVTKWEAERSYPEMDKLLKMCDIFGCTLDDLVKGDLVGRASSSGGEGAGQANLYVPEDICGYDEHQRMMARKVPSGVAVIIAGAAVASLFSDGLPALGSRGENGAIFTVVVLAFVLAGLALLVPAGMAHSAFRKAHPYVQDFYTEDDRVQARRSFARGLIIGLGFIFAGIGCHSAIGEASRSTGEFLLLSFVAAGVWCITRYGMLLGRVNVAEYNKAAANDLNVEDIANAPVDDVMKETLLRRRGRGKKLGALCGSIMIVSTIVGLALLFVPALLSPSPSQFRPEGTTAMWFWVAWPVGGMLCGIVALLWEAFAKEG